MSSFLMVVPEGWVEVPGAWITESTSPTEVSHWLATESWNEIERVLIEQEVVPVGKNVLNAQMISADGAYRMWVLFG